MKNTNLYPNNLNFLDLYYIGILSHKLFHAMKNFSIFILIVLFLSGFSQIVVACKKHFIGESYGGGIVFYVTKNGRHGLIASKEDQGKELLWYVGKFKTTGAIKDGLRAGAKNTKLIVNAQTEDAPKANIAAKACADYSININGVVYDDWYLPSKYELSLLYDKRNIVGITFDIKYSGAFWSSTESDSDHAVSQDFRFGTVTLKDLKGNQIRVRAIRYF